MAGIAIYEFEFLKQWWIGSDNFGWVRAEGAQKFLILRQNNG